MNPNTASQRLPMNRRQFIRATLAAAFAAAAAGCTIKTSTSNDAVKGIYILYTSDIHCGVDQHFGLAGLEQVRQSLEA